MNIMWWGGGAKQWLNFRTFNYNCKGEMREKWRLVGQGQLIQSSVAVCVGVRGKKLRSEPRIIAAECTQIIEVFSLITLGICDNYILWGKKKN